MIRYPNIVFPLKIHLEQVFPLEISIVTKSFKQPLNIPLDEKIKSNEKVPISVTIDSGTFEIVDQMDDGTYIPSSRYYDRIFVPIEEKDSDPVIFYLKPKKEGAQNIDVKFYRNSKYLGKVILIPLIELTKLKDKEKLDLSSLKPLVIYRQQNRPEPDLTVIIHETNSHPFEFKILIISPISYLKYPFIPIDKPIRFKDNPESIFRSSFSTIERSTNSATNHYDEICDIGKYFYEELFPPDFKNLYWKLKDSIKSIRVISKEPWIPWEIIKPWNGNQEEDFLCMKHSFSRWYESGDDPFPITEGIISKLYDGEPKEAIGRHFKKIKLVMPKNIDLPNVIKERDWIVSRFNSREKSIEISVIYTKEELKTALKNGGFDILHISTHGQYDRMNPNNSTIDLDDGQLKMKEISGKLTKFGETNPIVILNSCQSSSQGFSLTSIQSWAKKFISAGASIFIGTLWQVNDDIAFKFSQELYTNLDNGQVLGEAVKNSRISCKTYNNPSWLAYQLYGHPNSIVSLGTKTNINLKYPN